MIDTEQEELISIPVAAATLPGGAVHSATVYRWCYKGCRGVKLETILRGGLRFTSRQAVNRFVQRLNAVVENFDLGSEPTN